MGGGSGDYKRIMRIGLAIAADLMARCGNGQLLTEGENAMTSAEQPVHTESETHGWTINVPNHPTRTDSREYVAARKKMNAIAAQSTGLIYGQGPFEDHHGGALWLRDSEGWFMVRNLAGIEWSAQFCADPAKVDLLRQNAKRVYDLLDPQVKQELDPDGLLDTPIQDAAGSRNGPIRSSMPASRCTRLSTPACSVPARHSHRRSRRHRLRRSQRQRTRSLPGCIITPRPSSTSSYSSTTISSFG